MSPTLITHIAALAGGGALGSFLSLTSQRFTPPSHPLNGLPYSAFRVRTVIIASSACCGEMRCR